MNDVGALQLTAMLYPGNWSVGASLDLFDRGFGLEIGLGPLSIRSFYSTCAGGFFIIRWVTLPWSPLFDKVWDWQKASVFPPDRGSSKPDS